jgi:hypothetical protein
MKPYLKSAVCAAVITMISTAVILANVPRSLAVLALPSFPGFMLAFVFGLGTNTEGIPGPTNLAVPVLTFAVWWGIIHAALASWRRRRGRDGSVRQYRNVPTVWISVWSRAEALL